ncbi:MAG: SAM-dependent methyltransferase [Anaerolineae bacterium CG_4_9_14_3_um_filter_57_17]|nr:SAM-dependent methyltransferase [bacterium]NCT22181.1 SAM-dependent methyltransferase [bacterium]OIO85406.1 MAG: SAM-dependent methyltransferase [Anaerolineae bacterium CG2_30_57_67]PJB64170.1 MAG: SAM-dependent methyltransferase [Anaerolineae bacterium CG_4_9_14_3_um_filter_57_17]
MRPPEPLETLLERALTRRAFLLDENRQSALRLFNGFSEGAPNLIADLFAATLVLHNYADPPLEGIAALRAAEPFYRERLHGLKAILVKTRRGSEAEKRGLLTFGETPATHIRENGVRYALNLTINRDTSFYMDTRNLRRWALENLRGKSVLNTFAYTGSLGVAALAGGAARVVQLDRNREFLNLAKDSCTLNGLPIVKADYLAADFFPAISALKKQGQRFDCVFLDPPFFSATSKGRVDLETDPVRLINKLRPLINSGGWLAAINNGLFVSGAEYLELLESLCADGFLQIERLIPVPEDFTARDDSLPLPYPADPAPFNHPTKIALLRVLHKN